jgi:hypothetical protein
MTVSGSVLTLAVLALGLVASASSEVAFAAKPQKVIEMSNGYPSGAHFNLNIHGKKDDYSCDPAPGGKSVFIPEYGTSTLQYVSNRKSSVTELTAVDRCAEAFDGDPAKVQLPKEEDGYYVFARVRAKPQNGHDAEESSIILVPDPVIEACNATSTTPDFGDATSCSDDEALLALGLVTTSGVYELTEAGLVRFDLASTEKGKGRAKAQDITGLFLWSGYVCDDVLDVNGDGVINELDVPAAYDTNGVPGIQEDELNTYLADQEASGLCTFYDNEWVFNVADLVVQDQDITNDGVKLLKVRFYPVSTTEFVR